MFGYLSEVDCLCSFLKPHRRTDNLVNEKVYSNASRILIVSEESDGIYLLSRDVPDKNKNRTALCSRIQKSRIKTPETLGSFLSAFDFELISFGRFSTTVFHAGAVNIEISKFSNQKDEVLQNKQKQHVLGNDEHLVDSEIDGLYLVKVFTIAETATDGEKTLSKIVEELEEQVQLIKPSVKWV